MISNPFSLNGRVALVTGGNSGIGRTLAVGLQEAGAKIATATPRSWPSWETVGLRLN